MADNEGQHEQPLLRAMGHVRLFGRDGGEISIVGRRTRGLLAYLTLVPEQSATRERLCGLLWSDRGDAQARSSLRQCLFELKTALQAADIDVLEASRDRVTLSPQMIASDVALLDHAIANRDVRTAVTMLDAMGQSQLLEDLELGGLFREWQEQVRGRINKVMGDGVLALLDILEAQRDWANLKRLADAWLRRDPLEENVVASAIRADLATGARAVAHRRFHAFEALLQAELGIAPGEALRAALAADEPAVPPAHIASASKAKTESVLAVLAFDNLSSDPEMEFFSEGISEEILQTIARTATLKVVARASSFQFRGREKVTSQVSAALGATHLLDGSVRRGGDKVRITAALIDCAEQTTIWSGRFDGDLTDVFALQDEIALAVAQALNLIFSPALTRDRINAVAHDLYLRARHLASAPSHVNDCISYLKEAVAIEPTFAAAWASLSMALAVNVRWMVAPELFEEEREQAILAAARATALNPMAGLPLVALSLLEPDGRYAAREALLDRAMELSPDEPEILKQASDFAGSVGRDADDSALINRAAQLDPLNPQFFGHTLYKRMTFENRESILREMMAMRTRWPDYDWAVAMPMHFAAMFGDWHIVDELLPLQGRSREWHMAQASAKQLRQPLAIMQAEARAAAESQIAKRGSVEVRTMLRMYVTGLHDEAFDAWARSHYDYRTSYRPDSVFLMSMIFNLFNHEIRKDVRFMDLCARLGLCEYWVTTGRWPDCVSEVAPYYDLKAEARKRFDPSHSIGVGR